MSTTSLRKKSIVDTAAKHVRLRLKDLTKKRRSSTVLLEETNSPISTTASPKVKVFYEGLDSTEITNLEHERYSKTGCFSPSSIIGTFEKDKHLPDNYYEYNI